MKARNSYRRVVICTVVGVLAAAVNGCDGSKADTRAGADSCDAQEAEQFEDLETLVQATLDSDTYTLSRFSMCEEGGEPRASLIARLTTIHSRKAARDLLVRAGWHRGEGPLMVSESLAYEANPISTTESDGSRWIDIYFRES